MTSFPANFKEAAFNHKNKIKNFLSAEISQEEFKKYLSSMGIYAESTGKTYMARIRNTGGILSVAQLKKISECAKKYSKNSIHLTTRQDVQFHDVSLENTAHLLEELTFVELYTKGTGGNCSRNVACSVLSGFDADEIFDVTDFALKTSEFLAQEDKAFNLPRKLKISFSNSSLDTAYASIADLGFIAEIQNGIKGFKVYAAGGLGLNPNPAIVINDFIPVNDYIYHVYTILNLFYDHGDRQNRNKARSRYILKRLGEDNFKNLYNEYLEKAKTDSIFLENWIASSQAPRNDEHSLYLYLHPEKGNFQAKYLDWIADFAQNCGYEISLKLSPSQGLIIAGLKEEDTILLKEKFANIINDYEILNLVSCVGSSICNSGICNSQELLSSIISKFKNEDIEIKQALPQVHISGCHNSCGQHQVAKIGFSGKLKKINDKSVQFYKLFLGGVVSAEKTSFGEEIAELPAFIIPEFLYKLANLKISSEISCFYDFISSKKQAIIGLANNLGENHEF